MYLSPKGYLLTRETNFRYRIGTIELFSWYSTAGGALYVPDDGALQKLFDDMKAAGLINPKAITPISDYPGLYYQSINADNTNYHLSLGSFNMYFLGTGNSYIPVGMSYYYNFDPQNRGDSTKQLLHLVGIGLESILIYEEVLLLTKIILTPIIKDKFT